MIAPGGTFKVCSNVSQLLGCLLTAAPCLFVHILACRAGDIVRVLDGNLNGSLVLQSGSATIAGRSYVNIIDRVLMNPTCSA